MRKLFCGTTPNAWAPLFLRLGLGVAMFPHGAQKALGWFGGFGFHATMSFFTQSMHISAPLAFLAITAEFAGGLGLIFGAFTRLSALGIAVVMSVAIDTVHYKNGLFMNWSGTQKGEGYEYHILAIAIALALIVTGAGKFSIDSALAGSSKGSGSSKSSSKSSEK